MKRIFWFLCVGFALSAFACDSVEFANEEDDIKAADKESCYWGDTRCNEQNSVEECEAGKWDVVDDCEAEGLFCMEIEEEASCETEARAFEEDAHCKLVELFDTNRAQTYASFSNADVVTSDDGVGIYYPSSYPALGEVSWEGEQNNELNIYFEVTYWVSFRIEFEVPAPLSLAGCTGIAFDLLVESPSGAEFRVSIADLKRLSDFQEHGEDELWWWDDYLLQEETGGEWLPITIPFDSFRAASGSGTRHNDFEQHFSYVAAVEFNLIQAALPNNGEFRIRNLRTY